MDWQAWLNDGCSALGMECGVVSVCCGRHLTVIHHADRNSILLSGDSFDRRGTFCEQVMQRRGLLTFVAPEESKKIRLGHIELETSIQSYIGYPLIVRDTVFGTLNFSSTQRKIDGFNDHDMFLVEMMAKDYIQYNLAPNQASL
ncbi:GAF domain-containing protein [Celerinatantimonas sp. YJH-8]|uniref:GAF domain-containing protein n=1 Tax=Celerinatantimonas sp. YJH-8 TaxID=3228714 RepID=UPI0038C4E7AA